MDIPRPQKPNRRKYAYAGGALAAVVLVTVALSKLQPAAPVVDRGTVWPDTVRRGNMVLQVRGPGTLVPEQIRWVSALTAGRIEKKLVQPGTPVTANTVLVEMSNPDVELQALEAERQLIQARSDSVTLKTRLETDRLTQEGVVATAQADYNAAKRKADESVELAKNGLISQTDLANNRDKAQELEKRLEIEKQRLVVMTQSEQAQITTQQSQIKQMRAVVAFNQQELASMHVRAGADGVLQDLPLEEGQWVTPGQNLAKVVQPHRLKAVLQIPEVQARDVALGQSALIDTRSDTIMGHVTRIDPAAQNGTVAVDVSLEGTLPRGARPDLSVDGTIQIARLDNVLYVGRPTYGQANSTVGLFKIVDGGDAAVRVPVQLGRASVNTVEIKSGLSVGDIVILSDMSQWDAVDRVRIK